MTETTVDGFEQIEPGSAWFLPRLFFIPAWEHVVAGRPIGDVRRLLIPTGIALCLLAIAASTLFLLSRSTPWLIGRANEPRWAWAIGSGRVKLWVAEPGAFQPQDTWTASWYHGLDGQPTRWDLTLPELSPGGVFVVALPLWGFAILWGTAGMLLLALGLRNRRVPRSGG
ncbi:MAG: hypothetical protein U0872_09795 [Planctomycetaceae bacterium]